MGGWLAAIGKGLGKGIGWLIRNPQVIDGIVTGVKAVRKKKPEPEPDAPVAESPDER